MKKWGWFFVLYIAVILVSVGGAHLASEVVTVFQQTRPLDREVCVIIDECGFDQHSSKHVT